VASASAFFLDRSPLAGSLITHRRRPRPADGGPSNTGKPNSYAVALDGGLPGVPDGSYHLAFIDQARGRGDSADERGIAGGFDLALEPYDGITVTLLTETVHFWNADAVSGQNRTYVTGAAAVTWEQWTGTVTYTGRLTDRPGLGAVVNDFQVQLSLAYEIIDDLAIEVGWKHAREDGLISDTIGVLFSYALISERPQRTIREDHPPGRRRSG